MPGWLCLFARDLQEDCNSQPADAFVANGNLLPLTHSAAAWLCGMHDSGLVCVHVPCVRVCTQTPVGCAHMGVCAPCVHGHVVCGGTIPQHPGIPDTLE